MCWPVAGPPAATPALPDDVTDFKKSDADRINDMLAAAEVEISSLGYYPNPLSPTPKKPRPPSLTSRR